MAESKGFNALFGDEIVDEVMEISVDLLRTFPKHPFKVIEDDNDMEMLIESVKEQGIIEPLKVMPKDDYYYIISGHRRRYAARQNGLQTVPCIIRSISYEEAVKEMVDANLHREKLLPSEKGFAYRMKMEASNHQGRAGSNSADEIGQAGGDSGRTVQRYIRLTYLSMELLELVDNGKISITNGVLLSQLTVYNQQLVYCYYEESKKLPNTDKCEKLKEAGNEKTGRDLTRQEFDQIMEEVKSVPKVKPIKIEPSLLEEYFTEDELSDSSFIKETIRQLLEDYRGKR